MRRTPEPEARLARLLRFVEPEPLSGCWIWIGCRFTTGYGAFVIDNKKHSAHRESYLLHKGALPPDLVLDHLCRNKACVNPAHLEPVTSQANVLRGDTVASRNHQKTECPVGHQYTSENTYLWPKRKKRHCRLCRAASKRRYRRETRQPNQEATPAQRQPREEAPAATP